MNEHLVTANLMHHPGRTLASVGGVALGVLLVTMTFGLVRGMLRDRGQRDINAGVELMVSERGQMGLSVASLPMTLPLEWGSRLREIPGVRNVTPVAQYLEMKGESGLGLRQIDGVDFPSYAAATRVQIVSGDALPLNGDHLIVDIKYATDHRTRPGDKINLLGRDFTVAGIYAPETGARMMIPLRTMQESLNVAEKCSIYLVKCQDAAEQEQVAQQIIKRYPDLRVVFTRDLPLLFSHGYAGLNTFLNVIAALASIISLLIISMTMYSSVMERTHQIGILKSLGASKRFIALVFVQESLLITGIGIVGGILITLTVIFFAGKYSAAKIDLDWAAIGQAILGGLLGGLVGALYPAIHAAKLDAIDAINHD